jgi:hypothetical protein
MSFLFRSIPFRCCSVVILLAGVANAAAKPHVIAYGKAMTVQWRLEASDARSIPLRIRALLVDGHAKEYFLDTPHEVTDRVFAIRRVFRVNDSLPEDSANPRWQWQRGGWFLVDRASGRVSPLNLPGFDAYYSVASWYRDYAAYCGVSDDGKKIYAVVAQINRRKPVLRKPLPTETGIADESAVDSACPAPSWQRSPVRVTFQPSSAAKQTFAIRGHVVDAVNDAAETEQDDEASK